MNRFQQAFVTALIGLFTWTSAQSGAEEPATTLRVAAAQIPVSKDISVNAATIHRAIDEAIREQADILLTPEGSLSGYTPDFDQNEVEEQLQSILKRTRDAGLALALGTCFVEPDDGQCYNELRFYDADGELVGFHTKTLLCGSMTENPKGEINHYGTRPLRTFEINGITVGGLICNDMWANPICTPMDDPHLSQKLSASGAKIIFHAINGGRNGGDWSENVYWPFHESSLRIRANAGKTWIVTADNCAPVDVPCSAPSGILGPDGEWAATAPPKGEHVVVHTISLGELTTISNR